MTNPSARDERNRPVAMIGLQGMEHEDAAAEEREPVARRPAERDAREREALRRRVRESLLRCPDANVARRA